MPGSTAVDDIREIKEILSEILKEKLSPGQQNDDTGKVLQDDDKKELPKTQNEGKKEGQGGDMEPCNTS